MVRSNEPAIFPAAPRMASVLDLHIIWYWP